MLALSALLLGQLRLLLLEFRLLGHAVLIVLITWVVKVVLLVEHWMIIQRFGLNMFVLLLAIAALLVCDGHVLGVPSVAFLLFKTVYGVVVAHCAVKW